jgi:hypothetical protein
MAAFVKSINAKIRANPMLNYVCSTRTVPSQLLRTFFRAVREEDLFLWLKADEGAPEKLMLMRYRFLGSGIEFRYPDCGGNGYAEKP